MKVIISKPARLKIKANRLYLGIALLVCQVTNAQFRTYSKVFSDNIKGGTTIFGNTLTQIVSNGVTDTAKMNDNRSNGNSNFGNDNSNIQYADVDGNTGAGAGTRNSSSADLTLPTGTNTIKLARLYWGGRVRKGDFDLSVDSFRRVKIRFGNNTMYTEYAAAQLDKNTIGSGVNSINQYQAYVDITPFIQANGHGTYTVGNVAASVGPIDNGGNYAGWSIVVVYENLAAADYNSVRVYDGFQQVYNGGMAQISTVMLTGLNVPSGPISMRDAKMGAVVWEGDAKYKQDYLKINGNNFYNELNAVDNPWNGTISDTGNHVTAKNPNFTNQMGIDIDQFFVGTGYGIKPGDTDVTLEFGTESDQYFSGLFTFQIKTNNPTIVIDKLVKDANSNQVAEANEVLTYTLKGKNTGQGNANSCVITDTLPNAVTYIPGSVKFISCAGVESNITLTDTKYDDQVDFVNSSNALVFRVGTGADASNGGILASQQAFEIEFKVTVNDPGPYGYVPPIINVARITALSDAGVKSTDDGTAILEPMGGPLPVTLKTFLANLSSINMVKLSWTTTMEINCLNYSIERSIDGRTFTNAGTLAGSGNSSIDKNYFFNDDISTVKNNTIYYRLKQTDLDGRNSYSKIISVRLITGTTGLTASPNPFSNYVNINIDWNKNEIANVKIISMNGKELISKNMQMIRGSNHIAISELASMPAGIYLIQVNSNEGSVIKQVSKL